MHAEWIATAYVARLGPPPKSAFPSLLGAWRTSKEPDRPRFLDLSAGGKAVGDWVGGLTVAGLRYHRSARCPKAVCGASILRHHPARLTDVDGPPAWRKNSAYKWEAWKTGRHLAHYGEHVRTFLQGVFSFGYT